MKIRKIVCPFLCLLLFGCSSQPIDTNLNPKQEIGETLRTIDIKDTYMECIQYPKTPYEPLNNAISKSIHNYKTAFVKKAKNWKEKRKVEFNVTYESYFKDDRYLSVALIIYENVFQKRETVETFVYDRKEASMISLSSIYEVAKLPLLSANVINHFQKQANADCDNDRFRIHSSAIATNFERFVLKKDSILFYFPEGTLFDSAVTYEVAYRDIEEATSLKEEDQETFVPYDQILNEPVKHIDANKPMVALTFDDGPRRRYTSAILDALKEYGASATFFVLGSNALNEAKLLQRMILEGNEIGNHTYSHKQLTTLSKECIEEEIIATQESIYNVTHTYPKVIRPPYGSKNATVLQCGQGKRFVNWNIDTKDWKDRNAKVVVNRVLKQVKDGDIILMHDLYASSAQAAIILIPKLQEMGYQLVTVSDLYAYRNLKP